MDTAVIQTAKITDYLLSDSHPIGRSKAAFFRGCGFSVDQPDVMIGVLMEHGKANVAYSKPTSYGFKVHCGWRDGHTCSRGSLHPRHLVR